MPVRASCPHCRVQLQLPENLLGKTLRCSKCQQLFRLPPPKVEEDVPILPLWEPEEPTAIRKDLPSPRQAVPTPPPAPALEEAEPQRRRPAAPRKRQPSLFVPLLLGGVVAAILMLAVGAFGAWLLLTPEKPARQPEPVAQMQVVGGPQKQLKNNATDEEKKPIPPVAEQPAEQRPQPPAENRPIATAPRRPVEAPAAAPRTERQPPPPAPAPAPADGAQSLQAIATFEAKPNFYVKALAYSPDGTILAAACEQGVRLWNVRTNNELPSLNCSAIAVAFSPDSQTLAVGGLTQELRLWDVKTQAEKKKFRMPANVMSISGLAFHPDGGAIAVASFSLPQRINLATGQFEFLPNKGRISTERLAYSPDGKVLAGAGRAVARWDSATGEELPSFPGNPPMTWAVCFSSDGKTLASAGADRLVKLWDAESGALKLTLTGHWGPVSSLAFSPQDQLLVSGSGGVRVNPSQTGEVEIWDVATGTELARIEGFRRGISAVAVSTDGSTLAIGSGDLIQLRNLGAMKPQAGGKPTVVAAQNARPEATRPEPTRPDALKPRPAKPTAAAPLPDLPGGQTDLAKTAPQAPKPVAEAPRPPDVKAPVEADGNQPAPLKDEREERALPSAIADACVGGGGRFLFLHLPRERKLAVFDANEAKVVKYLPLAEDKVAFAAGLIHLIIGYPNSNVLQRWNLTTFEKEATVPCPSQGTIGNVVMGSASSGPLLICFEGGDWGGKATFIDPKTFRPLELEWTKGQLPATAAELVRASADGPLFGWRCGRGSEGHDMGIVTLNGKQAQGRTQGLGASLLLPGNNGRYFYTSEGVLTSELQRVFPKLPTPGQPSAVYVPARQGDLFLQLHPGGAPFAIPGDNQPMKGSVAVMLPGQDRPLVTLRDIEGVTHENLAYGGNPANKMHHDKRIHLIPDAKLLITIPNTNDRLILRRFDLDDLLAKADVDYLFVASQPPLGVKLGEKLVYQVVVKSKKGGVKYKLESGPPGMAVSATGMVLWTVPADLADKSEDVILTVSDSTGQEVFHTFSLAVQR